MQNKSSQTIFDIKPFSCISEAKKKELMANLKQISLQPGEQINDFDKLASGIVYVQEGVFRLLGLDDSDQMFTLECFSKGEIFGGEQILRGVTGQVFAASTKAKGQLLPAEDLFKLLEEFLIRISNLVKITKSYLKWLEISKSFLSSITDFLE